MDEGYIKFQANWKEAPSFPYSQLEHLLFWRQKAYEAGWIGAYPDGIGFGNISQRESGNRFFISGSATGNLPILNESHFSLVTQVHTVANDLKLYGSDNSLFRIYEPCDDLSNTGRCAWSDPYP